MIEGCGREKNLYLCTTLLVNFVKSETKKADNVTKKLKEEDDKRNKMEKEWNKK
ncbi:hypothetical protein [Cardinium endosymbiont of Sogatella furcifera]|uniref:hypothetical protein n=1 Tax=Cardinium endosymbiont of Sogatella furcifera TaxID=650378 RepID=UPI0013B3A16F|nr:hypothetical protein [Cardinium endosymbiont of Sogatella furcifera]